MSVQVQSEYAVHWQTFVLCLHGTFCERVQAATSVQELQDHHGACGTENHLSDLDGIHTIHVGVCSIPFVDSLAQHGFAVMQMAT
jgi:hypothetical protein